MITYGPVKPAITIHFSSERSTTSLSSRSAALTCTAVTYAVLASTSLAHYNCKNSHCQWIVSVNSRWRGDWQVEKVVHTFPFAVESWGPDSTVSVLFAAQRPQLETKNRSFFFEFWNKNPQIRLFGQFWIDQLHTQSSRNEQCRRLFYAFSTIKYGKQSRPLTLDHSVSWADWGGCALVVCRSVFDGDTICQSCAVAPDGVRLGPVCAALSGQFTSLTALCGWIVNQKSSHFSIFIGLAVHYSDCVARNVKRAESALAKTIKRWSPYLRGN
jgi:hypothetical protein